MKSILNKIFRKTSLNIGKHENKNISYFRQIEIDKSIFIKKDFKPLVLNKFFMIDRVNYGESTLTNEEKKELGISVRRKVYKDTIEIANELWFDHYDNPKQIIDYIFIRAQILQNLANSYYTSRELNLKSYTIVQSLSGYCDWCSLMKNKDLPAHIDIVDEVIKNCSCTRSRGVSFIRSNFE